MTQGVLHSLVARLRWIVVIAWIVAAIRFGLDFRQQEDPIFMTGSFRVQLSVGVYYVMLPLLLIGALSGTFDGLSYGKLVLSMLLLGILCWGIPNVVIYATAQFKGWQHGRFHYDDDEHLRRGPPIADTTIGKLGIAFSVGGLTSIAGFVWSFVAMHLLVLLPRRLFRPNGGRVAPSA